MSALAPTLEAFFTERLLSQRRASPHTIAAYRDAFCLLLGFAQRETGKAPTKLEMEDLDSTLIGAFLDSLERDRRNSVRTRNARLAAIHSLFRFAALRHPDHAGLIQRVLAIPPKRFERKIVAFLTDEEVEALVAAPDRTSFLGRRDHALMLLAIQTGLRVSELVGLKCEDVIFGVGAHVRCVGKGRKERATPLTTKTAAVLKAWLGELDAQPAAPLFPTRQGAALSRYGVTVLIARHADAAAASCQSLAAKKVSPHVLRHTAAMRLLHAGVDTSVIALWLGHEGTQTTQIYVHADLRLKERALARTAPITSRPGRYRAPDQLLAFLQSL
jgi:site-specific recombinase XerD